MSARAGHRGRYRQGRCEKLARIFVVRRRFPESESSTQFWSNLLGGVDMVTQNDRRWPVGLHDTPARFGKLVEYDRFDASFFSVHGKQAQARRQYQASLAISLQSCSQAAGSCVAGCSALQRLQLLKLLAPCVFLCVSLSNFTRSQG